MKITVRIKDVEVTVERPKFGDYDAPSAKNGSAWRENIMKDTIIPTLTEAVNRAKELYQLRKEEL